MTMRKRHDRLRDWNVLVTVYEEEFREARRLLAEFGEVAATGYHNVMTMRVGDPARFMEDLEERVKAEPGILNSLSHVVPAEITFDFETAEEFEERARAAVLQLVPRLMGLGFHVRIHRRGFKHRLPSQKEEQYLGEVLLDALEAAGSPGSVAFEDVDAVVSIETLDHRAGVSLWTREDLQRYPFLRMD
jgi:tRNA(Ser,Leu) C12 N-acetylase TAN1